MHSGTYPRATRLRDGSLVGSVAGTVDGKRFLNTIVSDDDGASWKPLGFIDKAPADAKDLDNAFLIQLRNNDTILAAFRNHDRTADVNVFSSYRITLCASDDLGASWRYVTQIAEDPAGTDGDWEPFLRYADDGETLQVYYSSETSNVDQDSILRTSDDDGATWSPPRVISGGDTDRARDGMLGVAKLGAKLFAVFESQPQGHFEIFLTHSPDDGASWDGRDVIYAPRCPGKTCQAGAPQIITVGDALVVSFMTDEDNPGPLATWPGAGATAKLIASGDGGKTWSKPVVLAKKGFWPGLWALDEKTFLGMAEVGGKSYATKFSVG